MLFIGDLPPDEYLFGKKPEEAIVNLDKKDEPVMELNGLHDRKLRINRIVLRMPCEVDILSVESPSIIWVRLSNHITDNQLTIREPYNLKPCTSVQLGDYAFVPIEGRAFGRCKVLSILKVNGQKFVEVFMIDLGRKVTVKHECLCEMEEFYSFFPWQAIKVSLNGSRPRFKEVASWKRTHLDEVERWTKDDCLLFREIAGSFARHRIIPVFSTQINNDYENPIVVNMYGLPEKFLTELNAASGKEIQDVYRLHGQSLLEEFNLRSGRITVRDILDAKNHVIYPVQTMEAEIMMEPVVDDIHVSIPQDWVKFTAEEEEEREREQNQERQDEDPDWDGCQIEPFTTDVLESYRDPTSNTIYLSVEGAYTKSPLSWYARPIFRQWMSKTDEHPKTFKDGVDADCTLLNTAEWMIRGNDRLKQFADQLDTFYSLTKNRKPLKPEDIKNSLGLGHKVFGICAVNEERAVYTGEWQRIQVLNCETFVRVRFLDTGGEDIVLQSSIYKINRQHCEQPPLCGHFSLAARESRSEDKWRDVDMNRFKRSLRDDMPMKIVGNFEEESAPENPMAGTIVIQDLEVCNSMVSGSQTLCSRFQNF